MIALKLDENLSDELLGIARTRGLDAESVRSQRLVGVRDDDLFERCRTEGRILVTLDLDFSNPIRFPPSASGGTIVLRPGRPSMQHIAALFDSAINMFANDSPARAIWIVEHGRVRIYRSPDDKS